MKLFLTCVLFVPMLSFEATAFLKHHHCAAAFGEVDFYLVAHHLGLFADIIAGHAVGIDAVAEDVS